MVYWNHIIILFIPKNIFILTFLDEYSWKEWLFTSKSRAGAPDIIIDFLKYLNNQFENQS